MRRTITLMWTVGMALGGPLAAQDSIPVSVVRVLSDSSYLLQIRGKRLIAVTESVFGRLLQADVDRRGAQAELKAVDSLVAAQERALHWSDSTVGRQKVLIAQLDSLYRGYRDVAAGWKRLAGEPWLTFDFGLGATGRDHNPAILAGLGIRRVRFWGFFQEANAGGAIGMSLRVF